MTAILIEVISPVFLILAAGYAMVRFGIFGDSVVDGLTKYTQGFAIPCLLFLATKNMNFAQELDIGMLASYYTGATICFFLGMLGARAIFKRRPGDAVAIGFGALFSNTVLLGLSIIERAYGSDVLRYSYAIIALNAPFCYFLGITFMETLRAGGRGPVASARIITIEMVKNPLMIGLALGVVANLAQIELGKTMTDTLDMITRSALPAALFGLGGVLTRYKISTKLPQASMIAFIALIINPAIVWFLGTQVFTLDERPLRAAVVLAAMSPGVNAYVFATMYNRGTGVNSTVVLLATLLSILTVPVWLSILP